MSRTRLPLPRYRRRILTIGFGLALLIFCIGFPIVNNRIEADLERRVPRELADAGFAGITASFSGQDGTLSCAAPLDDPEAATEAAYDVHGVRKITLERDCRVNRAPVVDADDSATDSATAESSSAEGDVTTTTNADFATIADAVADDPDLSFLTVLLGEAGLTAQLDDAGADPVTLFAPTDAAFDALPADVNAQLRSDPTVLAGVLGRHVVSGALRSTDLRTGPLTALDGSTLDVVVDGDTITIDGARVVTADVVTGNGVVHVIEEVLLPDDVAPAAPTASVEAGFDGATVTLDGTVRSEVERVSLTNAATAALGDGTVVDRLSVDPDTGLGGTDAAGLAALIGSMSANLTSGVAGFDGTALYIRGVYADDTARDTVLAAADLVGASADITPPPEPSAESTQAAAELETELNDIVTAEPIRFEINSAVLTDAAATVLDDLASKLTGATGLAVTIAGHTDSDGDAPANLNLSQQRAEAVLAALVERGIDPSILTAEGFGETEPVVVDGVEDKDASRRVEFRIEATA